MDETKTCTKCGKTLPATTEYFYALPKGKRGVRGYCRECQKAESHQRAAERGRKIRTGEIVFERPEHKTCRTCSRILPATTEFFYKHEVNKDGLSTQCTACITERARAARAARPKKVKEPAVPPEQKICTTCGKALPTTTEFFYRKNGKWGLDSRCKSCTKEAHRQWRAYRRERLGELLQATPPDAVKTCIRCGQEKPATTEFFNREASGQFGLASECSQCLAERYRSWCEEQDPHKRSEGVKEFLRYLVRRPRDKSGRGPV